MLWNCESLIHVDFIPLFCYSCVTPAFFFVWNSVRFSLALRPQKPSGLLGTGSPGRPPRLSHSTWALLTVIRSTWLLCVNHNIVITPTLLVVADHQTCWHGPSHGHEGDGRGRGDNSGWRGDHPRATRGTTHRRAVTMEAAVRKFRALKVSCIFIFIFNIFYIFY